MYQISSQYLKRRLRKDRKTEWTDSEWTDRQTDKGEETYSPPCFTDKVLIKIKIKNNSVYIYYVYNYNVYDYNERKLGTMHLYFDPSRRDLFYDNYTICPNR